MEREPRTGRRRVRGAFAVAALAALLALPGAAFAQGEVSAAEEDNLAPGFDPQKGFSVSDLDSVNLFNGSLTVQVPLGAPLHVNGGFDFGLSLTYTSQVWNDEVVAEYYYPKDTHDDFVQQTDSLECWFPKSRPREVFHAGMGWSLGLPRLFLSDPDVPAGVTFLSASGAKHHFHPTLHEGQAPAASGFIRYTRDSSYLRLRRLPDGTDHFEYLVETPDGETFVFTSELPQGQELRLVALHDAFGNMVTVTWGAAVSCGDTDECQTRRTLIFEDDHDRTWTATFETFLDRLPERLLTKVETPGFGGAANIHQLRYDTRSIGRSCKDRLPYGRTESTVDGTTPITQLPRHVQGSPDELRVAFLEGIDLPDGTSYAFGYLTIDEDCTVSFEGVDLPNGRMVSMTVPTRGTVAWEYGSYIFPSYKQCLSNPKGGLQGDVDGFECPLSRVSPPGIANVGVTRRTIQDGPDTHTWHFIPRLDDPGDYGNFAEFCDLAFHELRTTEVDPTGHRRVAFHSVFVQGEDEETEGWRYSEYGLPFTRSDLIPDGSSYYLSSQQWSCDPSTAAFDPTEPGSPPGCTKVRSEYVRYEREPPPGGLGCSWEMGNISNPDGCSDRNDRVVASRAVYHDDPNPTDNMPRWTEIRRSDFDGLGHYRTTVADGNFKRPNGTRNGTPKTTTVGYNPWAGQLSLNQDDPPELVGVGSFRMPASTEPWILETYSHRTVQESGSAFRTDFTFDFGSSGGVLSGTTFLRKVRKRLNLEAVDAADAVVTRTPNANGNVAQIRYSGGDAPAGLGSREYRLDQTWQHGALQSSTWVDPADESRRLLRFSREIDEDTGLVTASTDAAGVRMDFFYDDLGRLTRSQDAAQHPGDSGENDKPAATTYLWQNPTPQTGASVTVRRVASASTVLDDEYYEYDGFGRLALERRWAGDRRAERETLYDGLGRVRQQSDFHAAGTAGAARGFTLSTYDPFGRVLETAVVDTDTWLKTARVELTYGGVGGLSQSSRVAVRLDAPDFESRLTSAPRWTEYDIHGRPWRILELSGPGNEEASASNARTLYFYDAEDRLLRVQQQVVAAQPIGGSEAFQDRWFEYDGRGFRTAETHPELGTAGNGTVQFQWFDARGNPRRTLLEGRDLRYTYDFAGRVTQVDEAVSSGVSEVPPTLRPLQERLFASKGTYGAPGTHGLSRGKLVLQKQHNYLELPAVSGIVTDVVATEAFRYDDAAGRLSERSVRAIDDEVGERGLRFTETFDYGPLGNVTRMSYPECSGTSRCPQTTDRTVTRGFEHGFLTEVSTVGAMAPIVPSIEYDPNGMVTRLLHRNQMADVRQVDSAGIARPASIGTEGISTGGDWASGAYAYDEAGNVASIGDERFAYDPVHRLVEAQVVRLSDSGTRTQSAEYDSVGNLHRLTTGGEETEFCAEPLTNRVSATQRDMNGACIPGSMPFTYDVGGNLIAFRDNLRWTFDALDRLVAQDGQDHRRHVYTVDGERLATWVVGGTSEEELWTLRGPGNEVVRELRGAPGAGGLTWSEKDYVYAGTSLVASFGDSGERHYHLDHLGSTRLVTDGAGNRVAAYTYYPFGEEATDRRTDGERIRFTGHERDINGETLAVPDVDDLDYMHARYYSPSLGRFLSLDPMRSASPDRPQSWNKYTYVEGNPLKHRDPDGRLLDTVLDVGFILYDLYDIGRSVGKGEGVSGTQLAALSADVAATFVPLATGAGLAVRGASHADDAVRGVNTAADAVRAVKQGTTVLGHYPDYIKLSDKLNARRFNVPENVWSKMTDAQRWEANEKFLDRTIARGDVVELATSLDKVKPGSYFDREIKYLLKKGYRVRDGGKRLLPPE